MGRTSRTGTTGCHRGLRGRRWATAAAACLAAAASVASGASTAVAADLTTTSIVYPYACTVAFVGGATYSLTVPVSITDPLNAPFVHTYGGGPIVTRPQVSVTAPSSAVNTLHSTGTSDWTSSDARIVWGGVTSPPTSFAWHVWQYPLSDQIPLSFATTSFLVPGPGDISPGTLSWDFQANDGVQAGFESGHVQCEPVAPVQVYASFVSATGPSCPHVGDRWTCRFSYDGGTQLWQVPPDVTRVTLDLRGSSGATPGFNPDIDKVFPGGRGGESVATVAVTPGEYLMLTIGGTQGFNGGGAGEFGPPGGGAADVRRAPYALSDRLVVAGGGGGGGFQLGCLFGVCSDHTGGAGGGIAGGNSGGAGGTQTSGGAPEPPGDPYVQPAPGALGVGGSGAAGGGGGYYGGGGSALYESFDETGGGGGGSGYVPAGSGNTTVAGLNSGDGSIAISYTSTTTPYTSRYTPDEASWLVTDQRFLRTRDEAATQRDAAIFMTSLTVLIRLTGGTPPNLGSAPGTGTVAVTTNYTRAENAALVRAAGFFHSDPPTVQRSGVALLAYLLGLSGH